MRFLFCLTNWHGHCEFPYQTQNHISGEFKLRIMRERAMRKFLIAVAAAGLFSFGLGAEQVEAARGRVVIRGGNARANAYYRGYNRGYNRGYRYNRGYYAPRYYNRGYYNGGYYGRGYYGGNRGYYSNPYYGGYGGSGIYFRF